jgi:hypothetical protein
MDWYISEKTEDEYLNHTAGIKAREDLEAIWKNHGMQEIHMVVGNDNREDGNLIQKLNRHINKKKYWKKQLACTKPGDVVYIQFPVRNHTIFLSSVLKQQIKNNVKIVLFVHDLEYMRHVKEDDISFKQKQRMKMEELSILEVASFVVVHNSKMKTLMHHRLKLSNEKMIDLEIFDYLIDAGKKKKTAIEDNNYSCIIAGNLDKKKATYVYSLPEDVQFELYGPNYTGSSGGNIHYHGSFPPAELPFELEGSFGLVWDGISVETCAGVYGEYLKVNNPHKTSLYLASGIPVIIWKEAALAEFIEREHAGIAVTSLRELKDVFANLTKEDYAVMLNNAKEISKRLTVGYYTMEAIRKIEDDPNN